MQKKKKSITDRERQTGIKDILTGFEITEGSSKDTYTHAHKRLRETTR